VNPDTIAGEPARELIDRVRDIESGLVQPTHREKVVREGRKSTSTGAARRSGPQAARSDFASVRRNRNHVRGP
jgi:hypothetical protein